MPLRQHQSRRRRQGEGPPERTARDQQITGTLRPHEPYPERFQTLPARFLPPGRFLRLPQGITILMPEMFLFMVLRILMMVMAAQPVIGIASSTYVRSKGILTVSSGIEAADYQRALDEILHQLQEIRDGHWEPWELEGARSTMRSALTSLSDSQGALENYCLGQAATGQSEDPETMQRLR